jgi:hypothetical protein
MYWVSNVNGYFKLLFVHSPTDLQYHLNPRTAGFPAAIQTGNLPYTSQTRLLLLFFLVKILNSSRWIKELTYICLVRTLRVRFDNPLQTIYV